MLTVIAYTGNAVEVKLNSVTYRGTSSSGVEHFLNIRYARPPTGPLRFAPPQPYTHTADSTIEATAPGPACPQPTAGMPPFFDPIPEISEDCLTLRIARPEGTVPDSNYPVVVWVHGGGAIMGSAYDSHFAPDKLIARSVEPGFDKPVIYVAIHYRSTLR